MHFVSNFKIIDFDGSFENDEFEFIWILNFQKRWIWFWIFKNDEFKFQIFKNNKFEF